MLDALVEQLQTRVGSVDNGERYMSVPIRRHRSLCRRARASSRPSVFGRTYSTPSRDMRLVIAMNVLTALPERIVRHPDLYVLSGRPAEEARTEVETLHARRARERTITYSRSDGSPWMLTVADILARKAAFESELQSERLRRDPLGGCGRD